MARGFNSTSTPASQRMSVEFKLPLILMGKKSKITVRRLSAAGAEVEDGITFASRTVALDGKIIGNEAKEQVTGGIVNVKASEAVLVSINQ